MMVEYSIIHYASKFEFFKVIKNDDGELNDEVLTDAFKKVSAFFEQPISNPVGKRIIADMKSKAVKYLTPEIISKEMLEKKIEGWYRT